MVKWINHTGVRIVLLKCVAQQNFCVVLMGSVVDMQDNHLHACTSKGNPVYFPCLFWKKRDTSPFFYLSINLQYISYGIFLTLLQRNCFSEVLSWESLTPIIAQTPTQSGPNRHIVLAGFYNWRLTVIEPALVEGMLAAELIFPSVCWIWFKFMCGLAVFKTQ